MTVAAALALGAVFGGGVWAVLSGLRPRRRKLDAALARLSGAEDADEQAGLAARLGLPSRRTRSDLACLGQSPADHLRRQAIRAFGFAFAPAVLSGLAVLIGAGVAWMLPVWSGLFAAAIAYLAGELAVHRAADAARVEYRHVLASYLDQVVIALSGGAGLSSAIYGSARAGTVPKWQAIATVLERARLLGQRPWDAIAEFGSRIGVAEFEQLAATVGLAGDEGARVRDSLAARTETMRAARVAEIEADNASDTEKMSLPLVLFGAGILAFVLYPSLHAVLTGL
jgi:Flp pilus assembly protein TadB